MHVLDKISEEPSSGAKEAAEKLWNAEEIEEP
jgi:hypothetical protein